MKDEGWTVPGAVDDESDSEEVVAINARHGHSVQLAASHDAISNAPNPVLLARNHQGDVQLWPCKIGAASVTVA